ncbi:hypothetical protein [Actinoallomurus sp. NPDC052274]|uniref:hypothetical protein n=1 Tax=Actinoallomurus sp. NPDC052274 TaxID=3155420 RepID=UPI003417B3DC
MDLDAPAESFQPSSEVGGPVRDLDDPVRGSVVEPAPDGGGPLAFDEFVGGSVSRPAPQVTWSTRR